ncbi:flavonol synthase 1-like [Oryza glaberrima]|uniref:flavonol synthase 1-like n=1 Tax=Oryza glaberrima TaxID=4538 RepID=UPI00224C0BC8|nr:flavonol synthase 1-like [Oryza glaberrima]
MAKVQSVQALASSLAAGVRAVRAGAAPGSGAIVAEAAAEWRLFQVVNHGVPAAVAELQRVGREFFALPQEEKARYAMDASTGKMEGYGSKLQKDLEGKKTWADFFFHNDAPPGTRVATWRDRETNEEYCKHMQRLTRKLFEHLSPRSPPAGALSASTAAAASLRAPSLRRSPPTRAQSRLASVDPNVVG